MNKFLLMTTGGTIDGEWSPAKDTATNSGTTSYIPPHLEQILGAEAFDHVLIANKDSRDITSDDQGRMVSEILGRMHRNILITAGTYQMGMMEGFLRNHDALKALRNRRVVFTGSTIPLHGYTGSDAGFNLGASLCALRHLPPNAPFSGICMNGSLICNGEGGKDVSLAQFRAHHPNHDAWRELQNIDFIHTGGSIDFELDGLDGLRPRKRSSVPSFRESSANIRQPGHHYQLPELKDSRELTRGDIDMTIDMLRDATAENVIITLGTFGMQGLYDALEKANVPNKTVVITGSRLPLNGIQGTDAPFQLGYALALLNYQNSGVCATFNGRTGKSKDILPLELQQRSGRSKRK